MTMIIHHNGSPSGFRQSLMGWLHRIGDPFRGVHASWRSRQNLRALESLPADTLKDIGWPTSDSQRFVRK